MKTGEYFNPDLERVLKFLKKNGLFQKHVARAINMREDSFSLQIRGIKPMKHTTYQNLISVLRERVFKEQEGESDRRDPVEMDLENEFKLLDLYSRLTPEYRAKVDELIRDYTRLSALEERVLEKRYIEDASPIFR